MKRITKQLQYNFWVIMLLLASCYKEDMSHFSAMDDVADSFFLPLSEIHPEDFGLDSIRRGLSLFLAQCR